jgi:hypothetical protein
VVAAMMLHQPETSRSQENFAQRRSFKCGIEKNDHTALTRKDVNAATVTKINPAKG